MSPTVFVAVLFSAFFQAGWNFYAKKSRTDKIALLGVGWLLFGVLFLPLAVALSPGALDANGLRFILASGAIHALYICFLGWGYTVGEISVVYPVARGLGVVGTTLGTLALGLDSISTAGALGISGVVIGTLLIGLKELPHRDRRHPFLIAILVACTVASYSLVDSQGAKRVPTALYLAGLNLAAPFFAAPYLLGRLRAQTMEVLRSHKLESLLVTLAGSVAYGIVLWAFTKAPAPYVAALREFSVVIASALGVTVLGERLYKRKVLGIALIIAGALCIRLAK